MNRIKKLTAGALAAALAALTGCTPSIGSGTTHAVTVDGYDVPAGVFIYYTMQGYSDASSVISANNNNSTPAVKDVRTANIDSIDSTTWIQNKATDYCVDFVNVRKDFEDKGCTLSNEDKDSAAQMAEYYYSMDSRLEENGVSMESMKMMAETTYMERELFKYYYGFEGPKGCSEDELKDYFEENYARVKYFTIDLTDGDGNKVSATEESKLRQMADNYAKQINAKYQDMDKMHEMDKVMDDYDKYVESKTTTEATPDVAVTTTTTAVTETTETTATTTTDPYENERLIQKVTTTAASEAHAEETETEAAEESQSDKDQQAFNEFVFNKLEMNKAEVYQYSDEKIYVIIRGDLRARMTEDDYWSEDYVDSLLSVRYYDEFTEMMQSLGDSRTVDKNKSAYRRYNPFKLVLE